MCWGIRRVYLNREAAILQCSPGTRRCPFIPEVQRPQKCLVGLGTPRVSRSKFVFVLRTQVQTHVLGYLPSNLLLYDKNIIQFAAESSSPQMRLPGYVDQLYFDGQSVTPLYYPAGQYRSDFELAAQFRKVHFTALIKEHGAAWQHPQFWKLREIVDERFRDSVAQILRLWIIGLVAQREDSEGINSFGGAPHRRDVVRDFHLS